MTKSSGSAPPATPAQRRAAEAQARLAAALRENLRRRKAQSRAREAVQPPAPGDVPPGETEQG
ncbi:hypothetical protein [Roseomonas marmotae]|uniref:DUF4169 family protein n=1 Tax=Roseomonas marmotae TaxID=2768161 RepID=A0ABS3KBN0_9PROT|nr:hypothetical protein [Roseomonas marmotae]MBO1074879.1 hypothetical protein [Roseomonas marmotae]